MNLNLWLHRPFAKLVIRSISLLIAVSGLFSPFAAEASFKSNLQGLNAGSTNWGGGPLIGWNELDYVPVRTLFTGGPATNQVITVDFDHTKSGTLKGIEDLSLFTNSPNVIITSAPVLSAPTTDIWRYTFTITITNALDGFVEFRARLAAGSHSFTGSSLNLSSPTLSIFKPNALPGFPDLAISKRGPSQAKPGQIITYTINYTNLASASTVAKGVQVSDVLPSTVTYVPGSASKGATLTGNTLTWDLGNLNPGKRGLLTYKVMVSTNVPITTTFANFAQILSAQDDANFADNTAVVTTTVVVTPSLIANDDFYSTDKYVPISIPAPGVMTNDFSSVTNQLTAVLVSIPDTGTVVFNADGSFTYTPLTNFTGLDQFAYVITIGTNSSGPAVVNINVTNSCDILAPANVTVGNDAGQCGAVVNFPDPATTGLCGPVSCSPTNGSFFPLGVTTVTCSSVDGISRTFLVTVQDRELPVIVCPSNLVAAANSGCVATNVSLGTPVASDNCGIASVTNNAPATFTAGTNVVTWTAVDNSGNIATCQQLVVVRDQTPPTIACPSNVIVNANSGCNATNVSLGAPVTSDNCGVFIVTNNAPATFPAGGAVVTWTVVDTSGNTATCDQLVTVREVTPPSITCPSNIIFAANSGCGATNLPLGTPVTSDNCGIASLTNDAPSILPVGTNVVTWTVTDTSGNSATCQQLVVVRDQTPPTITCPSNLVVTANSGCGATNVSLGTPVTADNCGVATVTNSAPTTFTAGTNVVTWTAVDTSGNTSSCQQLVVVRDPVPPTITCPSNITVAANSGCAATNVALGTPVTSDNCGVASVTNNAPASFILGTNVVTWTVTDSGGNTATCQQLVVVQDLTVPTISCPSNVLVAANSGCSATNVSLGSPVTSDNCGVASTTNNAPASFALGTNIVTWTVTDNSGNSATCQQLVIVRDQTLPTITCPSNVVVNANSGCSATNVALGTPVTSDNCGVASVTNNAPALFVSGTNIVTWTVVDNSGNTATCEQLVVVRDQVPPTITCPSNITVAANSGCAATNVTLGAPVTSDNCGVASVTNNAPASFGLGTNVVTWTVSDANGNTATCQQLVIVRDQTLPTITCPSNVTVAANSGCSATNVALGTPATSDNCGVASVTNNAPASFSLGTNVVTWTAVDTSGNTATCQQLVIVRDQTPPTITCPSNIVRSTEPGQCSASNVTFTATVADGCSSGLSVSYDPSSGSTFPKGITVVTVTAADGNGNSNSCSFTVTVNDTEKPTIICPSNTVVTAPFGQNSATVGYSPVAADNCPGVTTTCVPPSGSSFPVGVTSVKCTATDASGNTNSCTFTVTVNPPVAGTLAAEFITSPMVLNRQTGLFEQSMRLRNTGATTVSGARVYVLGLPSTNTLYNRNGAAIPSGSTNPAPYVEYDLPLAPGSNVVFLLEYFIPDLKAITNQTLLPQQVAPAQPPGLPPGAQPVALQTGRDALQLANGRFLIEWPAIAGRSYTVQYSSDMTTWKTAVQSIVAAGTAVQWMDDGPPKTDTPPSQAGSRFYRVFLLPAN